MFLSINTRRHAAAKIAKKTNELRGRDRGAKRDNNITVEKKM